MTETANSTVNGSSNNMDFEHSNQDLIIFNKRTKRRKYIISAVMIILIIVLAIVAIILFSKDNNAKQSKLSIVAPTLTLEDYLNGKFQPKPFNATWTSDDKLIYSDNGNVMLLDLRTNTSKILLNSSDSILLTAFDFQLSADGLYLLVALNYHKLFRHSYIANYVIVELSTGVKMEAIKDNVSAQLALWSPIGNGLVYVKENNIYYKESAKDGHIVQITSTTGYVSNGVPDWVNEEEVLSSNTAVWFSKDGKQIVYGRYNDTDVPLMVIPIYGDPGKPLFQYPRANVIKYPKSGTNNPIVTLHLVNLEEPSTTFELRAPDNFSNEVILSAVQWANADVVTAIWMNRVQNEAVIVGYNTTTTPPTTTTIKTLKSRGWLELFTAPIFSKNGDQFVMILSQEQHNNAGGYRHIFLYNVAENSEARVLTSGKFVVTSIVGWDYEKDLIYYLANTEDDSTVQHLYTVSPVAKNVTCLSCQLTSLHNTSIPCSYNTADFSKNGSFYVLTCAGPDVPQTIIINKNGEKSRIWNNNEELVEYLHKKEHPIIKKMSFDVAGGFKANVMLRLPANMDTTGQVKYPMLVNVYGGPDTYQVVDKFVLDWGSYLAANKSVIYAAIDARGSGLRGDNLLFAGYRNLGTVEVIDQINVTKLIQKSLPFVDSSRTAIWGWSYGGYASGMALAKDTEGIFKCAISVAPVTDWTLYDSIYTERYMGLPTPSDNYEGYQKAQLLRNFEGIRNKKYFLIHGTHDDNVHYQQSMLWSKVLEFNDILFRQQSYPDEDHSLGSVRPHLYHTLENFLDDCFIKTDS